MSWNQRIALLMGLWNETARVTAQLMAAQEMRLLLVSPDYAAIKRTAWQINSAGDEAQIMEVDLHDWGVQAMQSFAAATCYGRIDVLCLSPFARPDQHDVRAGKAVGITDAVPDMASITWPLLACLPPMMQQNYGRIIVNISDSEQWGAQTEGLRAPVLEYLMGIFIGELATALIDYDITANVLMPAAAQQDAEAKAQAIVHLASEEEGGLTGHVVKVVRVETSSAPVFFPLWREGSHLDQHLLSRKALCHLAMHGFEHRMN